MRTTKLIIIRVTLALVCLAATLSAPAQVVVIKDNNGIAERVTNNSSEPKEIRVYYEGGRNNDVPIPPGKSYPVPDPDNCTSIVCNSQGGTIYKVPKSKPEPASQPNPEPDPDPKPTPSPGPAPAPAPKPDDITIVPPTPKKWATKEKILGDFKEFLDEPSGFYSSQRIKDEEDLIGQCVNTLDTEQSLTQQYVDSLKADLATMQAKLAGNESNKETLVQQFLANYTYRQSIEDDTKRQMNEMLNERLNRRQDNSRSLADALQRWDARPRPVNWSLYGLIALIAALALALAYWVAQAVRRNRQASPSHTASSYNGVTQEEAQKTIVVRRKTTSILKKQSLEDVVDNPSYLPIDCNDFCAQSAVRRIYIKNTCIKDIYNMYAEDLRNPENPKEDGCMVLGRWVQDKENGEYYVSLEHAVMPGDDAVFKEEELTFGAKIKVNVRERLRKLRMTTDLQYDLTCWVHSHPGLGVFFSNFDNALHLQHRHPTHPNFLTAMVVDILTPEQTTGIFTIKPDGSVNSKSDLTRFYSLEEMYRWAIKSERNAFKREDHFDTLAQSAARENGCHGVHLSNSAIIDIDQLVVEHENGMAGMAHGFVRQDGPHSDIVVSTVNEREAVPDTEPVGCFIIAKYCSIPTVRRAIERHIDRIRVVLVYSTADGTLTTIPVRNHELITNESYYGEQKLEDLKIWTRRKR